MRSGTSIWLAAAVAVLGLVSPPASAWDGARGSRYSPAYYGPPVHTASPPSVVYPGPPVYAYSYVAGLEGGYSGRRVSGTGYYTARINVFRGPRWDYSAAYYTSPTIRRAAYGGRVRRGGAYRVCPRYRAYIRGPIVRSWRR